VGGGGGGGELGGNQRACMQHVRSGCWSVQCMVGCVTVWSCSVRVAGDCWLWGRNLVVCTVRSVRVYFFNSALSEGVLF
jgi:hypothetical protein